jgi:chloramphenicol 3-O phosphotransferase
VSDALPGWVVVLNGPPRSGKSSIADVIQETFDGPWLNLGVEVFSQFVTPPRLRPGIGLRPGGERPVLARSPPSSLGPSARTSRS